MPGSISRREANTCRASSGDGLATKAPRLRSRAHQPFEGQHLQGRARHGAADVEQRADLAFRQLGAGRQPPVDDGVAQLVADRLRAILGLAPSMQRSSGRQCSWRNPLPPPSSAILRRAEECQSAHDRRQRLHTIFAQIARQSHIFCAMHNAARFDAGIASIRSIRLTIQTAWPARGELARMMHRTSPTKGNAGCPKPPKSTSCPFRRSMARPPPSMPSA